MVLEGDNNYIVAGLVSSQERGSKMVNEDSCCGQEGRRRNTMDDSPMEVLPLSSVIEYISQKYVDVSVSWESVSLCGQQRREV